VAAQLIKRTYDKATGFTEEYYWEEPLEKGKKGKLHIRRLQDVEGVLDDNAKRRSINNNTKMGDGLYHLARIPFVAIEQMLREDGFNWFQSTDAQRRKILRDSKYSKFLVRDCKI